MDIDVNDVFGRVCAQIVGRRKEIRLILSALAADKAVLLEGAPGTSKTTILRNFSEILDVPFYFVEGNEDLTVPKLIGHFDPSAVLQTGYKKENFRKGPLAKAMEEGGILYIEEINRAPPETLNVLLVSLSEKTMDIPRYGNVNANANFSVVATQNPLDDIGVSRISRGVLDRFVSLKMLYQSKEEEIQIVKVNTQCKDEWLIDLAVEIIQRSRKHPDLKAGASIRGAIDFIQLIMNGAKDNYTFEDLLDAAIVSLRLKIWPAPTSNKSEEEIIYEIISSIFEELQSEIDTEGPGEGDEKKEEHREEDELEKELFPEKKSQAPEDEEDDMEEINVAIPEEIEGTAYPIPLEKTSENVSGEAHPAGLNAKNLVTFDSHPTHSASDGIEYHKRQPREYMKQLARVLSLQVALKRALRATPFGRREGRLRPHKFNGDDDLDIERTIENLVQEVYPKEEDFIVRSRETTSRGAMLLVDCSESMRGEKIEIAILIASILSYAMNRKHDNFGVIAYNTDQYLLKGLNQERQIDRVVTNIVSLRHTMLTDIRGALEVSLDEFTRTNAPKKIVFLISDCVWTHGEDPRDVVNFFDQVNVFYIPQGRPWFAKQLAKNGRVLEVQNWKDIVTHINEMLAAAF
ncbi:AAA family ATPase [Candidatus Borrarchaeum sp.]|uniref:AAA family ATPase n=1 Tax=Candidatus Borrarchaeum sp. TaxID=2846742 RepID=UPI00257F111A|nr:AAA family ATPase [Candidatus Borrarchaeum sp.]